LKIRCEKCATSYHLDQKKIEPFGSKVRCSRCGTIFWVEPPTLSFSVDHGLSQNPPKPKTISPFPGKDEPASIKIQPAGRILWTLGVVGIFMVIVLTARFFYVQYLHPNWSMADTWSKVFFFKVDPDGNQKLSLINVKNYYIENAKAGQLLVIEGEIKNGYPTWREKVKVRASLMKSDKKVVMSRDVYAGRILTSVELETLSIEEISRLQSTQPEQFPMNTRISPGKTIPFMIFFPPLPTDSPMVSLEVIAIGSQKVQSSSFRNLFLG
jgi:predicted Zn finger-like uncharacterized protein